MKVLQPRAMSSDADINSRLD